jgi:thioester reductase-like protein
MIVNQTKNGWEIIYHRAHALLAAQLAGQWDRTKIPTRFFETIAAISHHDDLEQEWQDAQLTDAGAPMDFTLDAESSIEQLAKLVESAQHRGRWVAMLVSMHICLLNQSWRGTSKDWDRFLDDQIEKQQQWRKALEISKDEADRAYEFMQWCDRLSLILCQQGLPVDERALEITSRLDNQRYDVRQTKEGQVNVEPWPFEKDAFTVNVEACDLSELKFEDNAALKAALRDAPIKVLQWQFAKSA